METLRPIIIVVVGITILLVVGFGFFGFENEPKQAQAQTISFVRSIRSTVTSATLNIGSSNTDRLVVIIADDESENINLTGVTVDGKNCNLVARANNTVGIGNHQEMWYCDEDDLGSSSGSVTVAILGGDAGWTFHAHLYTGVYQGGPRDIGIDQTSASVNTVRVTGIDVPANGLVIMGAGNGQSGSWNNGGWTSPLIERRDGAYASAVFGSANAVEPSAQTNKTYIARASAVFNRGTAIVAVWGEAGGSGAEGIISGWAWSDTVGWISFNCSDFGCANSNFEVSVNFSTGEFAGWAWSDVVGWIDFNPSGPFPAVPNYAAKYNSETSEVDGWVRVFLCEISPCTGWDGWILLGDEANTWANQISINLETYEFEGWAWGDEVVGWISFNCNGPGICGE